MLRTRVVEERPEYGAFYTAMYTTAYIKSTRTLCIRVYVVYAVYCIRTPQAKPRAPRGLSAEIGNAKATSRATSTVHDIRKSTTLKEYRHT